MTNDELAELLLNVGFITGWVLQGDQLILWEHDEQPPAPLMRPE